MLCSLTKGWPLGCHKHQGKNRNAHPVTVTNYKPDVQAKYQI